VSITNLQGVIAGLQPVATFGKGSGTALIAGRPQSTWGVGLYPTSGTFNSTLNGGTYSSTGGLVTGQLPHYDPASGNSYLARFQVASSVVGGSVMLCDRLWDNGAINITSTSLQTIASPTWPARDNTGTTNGAGVYLAVEVSAATGAGNPTLTLGYTNSAGTASRTGVNIDGTAASSTVGLFHRIGVQAGDVGVQSVQGITLSATWTSGTINVVAYRVLAILDMPNTQMSYAIDALTSGFPQIFNGTVPFLVMIPGAALISSIYGQYQETQG
jgi:hypothetical protein